MFLSIIFFLYLGKSIFFLLSQNQLLFFDYLLHRFDTNWIWLEDFLWSFNMERAYSCCCAACVSDPSLWRKVRDPFLFLDSPDTYFLFLITREPERLPGDDIEFGSTNLNKNKQVEKVIIRSFPLMFTLVC